MDAPKPAGNSRPWEHVQDWFSSVDETDVYLSAGTIMEKRVGIEKVKAHNPQKAAAIEAKLNQTLSLFATRVLPVTMDVADQWGKYSYEHGSQNNMDHLIAANAKVAGFSVVTRNVRDFQDHGVRIIDPFKSPAKIHEP